MKTLTQLCMESILDSVDLRTFSTQYLHLLCRHLPAHICDPILARLREQGILTDNILLEFLNPARSALVVPGASLIRNSIWKQLGYHCPRLLYLDLSGCAQVGNGTIRSILQSCLQLTGLRLDGCHRISDGAFDMYESPFQALEGCQSLEMVSLQGCNQITGKLAENLNKNCRSLTFLNLSQCKKVQSPAIKELFNHSVMRELDLSYIDAVCDDVFFHMPQLLDASGAVASTSASAYSSTIENLSMRKAMITDATLRRMCFFKLLKEIHLEWCAWISDDGVAGLARGCPLLQAIDLKSCPITDRALGCIADYCKQLKRLNVSWCLNVTDGGMKALVCGSGSSTTHQASVLLERLSIVWCSKVTDASLRYLRDLPSLRALDAQGCAELTADGIAALQRQGVTVCT